MKVENRSHAGIHLRHDRRADDDARHQADDHRHHAPPDVGQRIAVVPQHVGVQHHLDQHERRIQDAVGQEQQATGTVIDENP